MKESLYTAKDLPPRNKSKAYCFVPLSWCKSKTKKKPLYFDAADDSAAYKHICVIISPEVLGSATSLRKGRLWKFTALNSKAIHMMYWVYGIGWYSGVIKPHLFELPVISKTWNTSIISSAF